MRNMIIFEVLYEISEFHGGVCEGYCFVGCEMRERERVELVYNAMNGNIFCHYKLVF